MKKTVQGILGAAMLTGAFAIHSSAMDGLGIKAEGTNIIVSWPSAGYENYVIQFRPTLDTSTPWTNLTFSTPASIPDNYPANGYPFTTYTNFGGVSISGGGSLALNAGENISLTTPLAMRIDGSGSTVPVNLYPPGFDLSDFLIIDPITQETMDGADYLLSTSSFRNESLNSLDPENPGDPEEGGGVVPEPTTGFYRVFLKPDFWYDYTAYTFTEGTEFMPIYLGVDDRTIANVKLLVDGESYPFSEYDLQSWDFGTPGNPDVRPTWGIWFHSDRLTNGIHTLQLVTTLQLSDQLDEHTPYITLTNPPFSTTINNPIIFKSWKNLMVGTNHTFNAKTTIYPANWEIDVWDSDGYWVTSATGTTTDGNISWTWDFYDDDGNLRDNVESDPYFDPWITVTSLASGSSTNGTQAAAASAQRPAPLSSPDYPYEGGWIIAYQDIAKNQQPDVRNTFLNMFFSLAGGPPLRNLSCAAVLLKYGRTNDIDMNPDPLQNMLLRNASWDTLRDRLEQPLFRNLYLFGHGSGYWIGGDWEKFDANGNGIGSDIDTRTFQVGNTTIQTTASLTSGWCSRMRPEISDAPHPYRFVFLDGCSTAEGDWPWAFGISQTTNTIEYYKNNQIRPSAFVGWNQTIYYGLQLNHSSGGWGDYSKFRYFRTEWMSNWSFNSQTRRLDSALDRAQQFSGWIDSQRMSQILCIYGLNELGFNDYNQRVFSFPE